MHLISRLLLAIVIGFVAIPTLAHEEKSDPFTVEYYYKTKWGSFKEFLDLYKRNHYPVLKVMQERGYILGMKAFYPLNHANETSRWDMRITVVYKEMKLAVDGTIEEAIMVELYPDQAKFAAEEKRRFELIEQHLDVPVYVENLSDWDNNPEAK